MRRPIDMRGRRAAGGCVVPYLYVPSQITAPSLSGGLSTGGVLTITPAVWLGGTSRPQSRTWQMQRAGVAFGAPLTVPTYTAVAADSAVALTVKEIATNPIGPTTSDASNAITVPAITTWAGSGLTYTAAVNRKPVADSLPEHPIPGAGHPSRGRVGSNLPRCRESQAGRRQPRRALRWRRGSERR